MKKLLFSLLFIFLNITLNAGQLSIFPELVSAGDSIILMYKNDAQTADATPLKAFVYLFSPDSSAPDACEYDLKQTANPNEYTTSFKIHKDVVFGAIKIYCRNADVLF